MASIKLKGDTSGEVTIQAPSVAGTNTLTLPATSSTLATQNSLGVRNLIINGDMRINQRGNYSTTVNGTGVFYSVDRWLGRGKASAGVFNILANSSLGEQPDRFTNHVVLDVTTASTPTSNDSYSFQQFIEGYNISKLNWGTSAAKSITLSFWAKSTLTGTFGGSVANGDYNRFNPFSYTISAANTWEYKTVTITGDTSGSWSTTNGNSMRVIFSIGAGSGRLGTAGTWTSSVLEGVTGQTNHIATNGSNLRITGVQIEEGTSATPFEHLQFGQQLALCQRYYEVIADGSVSQVQTFGIGHGYKSDQINWFYQFKVSKRTEAFTLEVVSTSTGYRARNNSTNKYSTTLGMSANLQSINQIEGYMTAISGITEQSCWSVLLNQPSSKIAVSAEL